MRVDDVLPGGTRPSRAETLHLSERTRITRLHFAHHTVILKEPLGSDAESRRCHETAILERLRGATGVVQLAGAPRRQESIVLMDAGETTLSGLAKPLTFDVLIQLSVQLVRTVASMHGRGVVHRDISPANIVMSREDAPCLVDFDLATWFAEIRPGFTHHTEIIGTLAYLAPEQTGRTGRSVDHRADLYALGATLYELATGEPPFGSGDPLRLTHDHLARVPVPPGQVNPAIPEALSGIILHLLEKEPDNRYQTADGLMYDLQRLRDAGPDTTTSGLVVGDHDFPVRLLPPSRLVGRDDELASLRAAFEDAKSGRCRGVLVGGAAGVGKTALVDELRPVVTASDGWFVVGKFDQYRRDLDFDAIHQALRALGRLLLAEPEDELGKVRARILRAVGPNTALLTATVPEFAAILAVPPDPGDPLTAQLRMQRATVEVLRAVASPQRPVVLLVDDLQWAGRRPLGLVDLVLGEEPVEGLLLVGAYRDDDLDASHSLTSMVSRWRQQPGLQLLRLDNLPVPSSVTMVAEMLRAEPATASELAEAINPHTHGNPYETVGVLNGLRRDGLLTATAGGWRWNDAAVRAHLGDSDTGALLAARLAAMPERSQVLVETMACLGSRAELRLLQTALAEPAGTIDQLLTAVLDEGLLVVGPGTPQSVQFGHDRTREVILAALGPERQAARQLVIARRLAALPELFAVAAEQYLAVAEGLDDPVERRHVVVLLRRAAKQASLTGDYSLVNTLLTAALSLIAPGEKAMLIEVHTGRHAALYGIGRLEEADDVYRTIEKLCTTAGQRAEATVVQVRSLTQRARLADAIGSGLKLLRELGITVPASDQLPAALDQQFDHLYRWLDTEPADDVIRQEITEPGLLAATRVINVILPPTFFVADHATNAWLSLEALRIWRERGPGRTLVGPASTAAFATVTQRGDYAAGYRAARRILALGEARGYEPDTSQARFYFSVLCSWFEPVERSVQEGQRARDGLIGGGDLANAGYCWQSIVAGLFDCALSLEMFLGEVRSGLEFARRTGSEQSSQWLDSYRWLVGLLRGESTAAETEPVSIDTYAFNPLALLFAHITRAVAAEIFGDAPGLAQHTAAAMPLLPIVSGHYVTGVTYLLRGLALAEQARATDGDRRGEPLSELSGVTQWLAARAANAPTNFLHMLRLLEAERLWAVGDFQAAALAFDAARREAGQRQRPWHRALIAERAGRFYLAHGLEHSGYDLLARARQNYLAWGAIAKVDQLDWAYPALRLPSDAAAQSGEHGADFAIRGSAVTTGTIDLLGILSGSQALSSETSIEGLHKRVVEVLSAMTGATGVHLVLWSDDRHDWLMPASGGQAAAVLGGVDGRDHALPMSVLRWTQRMGEPLVVADATRDDRFVRDPYFTGAEYCSLLAVPVVNRGMLRAVLLLENRLLRNAFTADRLEGVELIAGQLAVSLDNAQLYAEIRRMAGQQSGLRRVATLIAREGEPSEIFDAVTDEMRRHIDAAVAGLWRFETGGELTLLASAAADPALQDRWPVGTRTPLQGNNLASSVLQTGRPARMDDYQDAAGAVAERVRQVGVRAAVGVPIIVEGHVWGLTAVGSTTPGPMPADTESRMSDFADLVATAIANAATRAELIASRTRIVTAGDEVRRRLERNLHDGAQQHAVSLGLQLRMAHDSLPVEFGALRDQLAQIGSGLTGLSEELRSISQGIHPAILSKGGLGPAINGLARRSTLPVTVDLPVQRRFAESVEVAAYYLVAEALTNAAKHAHASGVTVRVDADDENLDLLVRDSGVGGADVGKGSGLIGLKDRVEALGGQLEIRSPPGSGTSLRARIPLQQP